MKNKALGFTLLLVALSAVTGCASVSPTASVNRQYDPEASRAYNLAQAAGMNEVRDTELGNAQYSDAMSNLQSGMSDAMLFNSSAGLGLSWGKSLGIGLLSTLTAAPGQTERDSIFGWVSTEAAANPEQARQFVLDHFQKAATGALDELGISYAQTQNGTKYTNSDRIGTSIVIDDKTLGCPSLSENPSARDLCGIAIELPAPGDRTPEAPQVTEVEGPAYWFEAHNRDTYIRFVVPQPKGSSVPKEAIVAEFTKRLPEGLYVYLAPDDERPAMVFDQGKAHLFIRRAG